MELDSTLGRAIEQAGVFLRRQPKMPVVKAFFDEPTFTATYVAHDPATRNAAIIDSVLDFDQPSGRTSFESANAIIDYVRKESLTVQWLLETHAHADHLSAAPYLKQQLGGTLAIGGEIRTVQPSLRRSSTKGRNLRATARSSTASLRTATASRSARSRPSRCMFQGTHRQIWRMSWAMRRLSAIRCSCPITAPREPTFQAAMPGGSIDRSGA